MTKQLPLRRSLMVAGIAALIGGLTLSTGYYAMRYHQEKDRKYNFEQVQRSLGAVTNRGNEYQLGPLAMRIVDGKPIPRNDAATNELRAFLQKETDSAGCKDTGSLVTVLAHTRDETQLLLGHGCGGADGRMYAVKKDGAWQAISPTNQFNQLAVPSCQMVNEHGLHKEIAPTCWTAEPRASDDAPIVYRYTLR